MGALNLFSKEAAAFDAEDRAVGSIFAAHAAVALSAANQQDQLEHGMESRDVIGQAKGILMARQHITADEAFDMLRRGSQRSTSSSGTSPRRSRRTMPRHLVVHGPPTRGERRSGGGHPAAR